MRLTNSLRLHGRPASWCWQLPYVAMLFAVALMPAEAELDAQTVGSESSSGSTMLNGGRQAKSQRASAITDVRVSSFQEITPGESTLDEIKRQLGQPTEELQGGSALVYTVGPFPRIEFILESQVVSSIIIHLATPATAAEIASELGLTDFQPVTVFDDTGERLGQVYPERGVVFSFASDRDDPRVSHLVLEQISAEPFLLRAQSAKFKYQRALADLDYASKLEPTDSDVHWQKARILYASQRHAAALEAADAAIRLDGSNPRYRLTRSKVLLQMDQHDLAVMDLQEVLDQPGLASSVKAQAECQMGDLLAAAPEPDFSHAIEHHQTAVELAADAATSSDADERRGAMQTLIDAHLAIANDITWGEWTKKAEVAPKWLRNANALVTDVIKNGGDTSLKLQMMCQALAAYAGMKGAVDPTGLMTKTLREAKELIADADDPLRQAELRWLLFIALFDAARIEQIRGNTERVLEYGQKANEQLDAMADDQPTAPRSRYLIGRLQFLVGSTHAIRKKDHEEAVRWYERARMYISDKVPATYVGETGLHGQRFVSMGVSYWKVDARDEAIQLTETGLQLMERAQRDGGLDSEALGVPYNNLAAMYRSLGRTEEASKLVAKAKEVEDDVQRR